MIGLWLARIAGLCLRLLAIVMPVSGTAWAKAMEAEAAYVEPGPARLLFAAGCLRAACIERLVDSKRKHGFVILAGLVVGGAFSSHAAVDGSNAWPLTWPLLGGAMAVWEQARGGRVLGPGGGAWLGLRTGLVAGLLFVLAGIVLIGYFGSGELGSRLHILAIGSLGGAALAALGGGAAAAFLARR